MTRTALIAAVALGLSLASARAQAPEEAPPSPPPAADPALNPLSALDKATLDGFRDMPLFTPSRRKPAPPPEAVEAEAPEPPPAPPVHEEAPPEIKLAGVVDGPEGAVAVVKSEGSGDVERLRLGDQIGGWLVTAIDPTALRITLDDREHEYRLFDGSKADEEEAPTPKRRKQPAATPDPDL